MSTAETKRGRFKVGDWVAFPYGAQDLIAQIAEARGPLGVHHRHLYRVRVVGEAEELDSFEMPEDDLEVASPPDRTAMIAYLSGGGLPAILRANLSGGGKQPRAWLTYAPW